MGNVWECVSLRGLGGFTHVQAYDVLGYVEGNLSLAKDMNPALRRVIQILAHSSKAILENGVIDSNLGNGYAKPQQTSILAGDSLGDDASGA